MKVAICLPIHTGAKPGFVRSLGTMMDFTHRSNMRDQNGEAIKIALQTLVYSSSSVAYSRNKIAAAALEWGADWLLWLDADQTFPADTLVKLLARSQVIVGAAYRRRMPETVLSTAYTRKEGKLQAVIPQGDGLEEVAYMGLGVCLMHSDVFRRISKPFFSFGTRSDGSLVGEDVGFFTKTSKAGIPAYVDHALSAEVGHVSDVELHFPK